MRLWLLLLPSVVACTSTSDESTDDGDNGAEPIAEAGSRPATSHEGGRRAPSSDASTPGAQADAGTHSLDAEEASADHVDASTLEGPPESGDAGKLDTGEGSLDSSVATEGDAGATTEGGACVGVQVELTANPAAVQFLISNAGGMFSSSLPNGGGSGPYGPYLDRWTAVGSALDDLPTQGYRFDFLSFVGFSPANGGECPVLSPLELPLPPSADAIYESKMESPLADALDAVYSQLLSSEQLPRHLILITDGSAESCHPELLDKGAWCGHDPAIAAVQSAFEAGITTFVVGLLDPNDPIDALASSDYLLDGLAHAGVGQDVQPPTDYLYCIQQEAEFLRGVARDDLENWREFSAATYGPDGMTYDEHLYVGPPDDELYNFRDGLLDLVLGLSSCSFEASFTLDESREEARVLVDGEPVAGDDWSLDGTELVLVDAACDAVRAGAKVELYVHQFDCGE